MELRRPTLRDKEAILEMIAEFRAVDSRTDSFFGEEDFDYEAWLDTIGQAEVGLGLPDGFVPYIRYVSFEEDYPLGFLNLRLRLNDYLLEEGGHIGYCIRPSERGKGYAKEQLHLGLLAAKSKNIQRVLVTCSENNRASRATILSQGGQLEDVRAGKERYWIDLD